MAKIIFKCRYIKDSSKAGGYLNYIATRDGVEKFISYVGGRPRSQGLFSDSDEPPALSRVAAELSAHEGVIFTPIISLRPEDAARLGFDAPKAWQTLLRSHANKLPLTA
jgi:hypothetical protein